MTNDYALLLVPTRYVVEETIDSDDATTKDVYKLADGNVETYFTSSHPNDTFHINFSFKQNPESQYTFLMLSGSMMGDFIVENHVYTDYWTVGGQWSIGNAAPDCDVQLIGTGSRNIAILSQSITEDVSFYGLTPGQVYYQEIFFSKRYKIPLPDQDYTITYSFQKFPFSDRSLTGQKTIQFNLAKQNKMIETRTYKWSGLSESEIEVFWDFVNAFQTSYQPFALAIIGKEANKMLCYYGVLEKNSVSIKKDRYDLFSVELSMIIIG